MRKYIAEFLGTALIVFIGTGAVLFSTIDKSGFSAISIALAFGFAIMAAIYAFGDVSGGHFNPAVSFAMAINKRLSWNNFGGYVISQILGAIFGSALVLFMAAPFVASDGVQSDAGRITNNTAFSNPDTTLNLGGKDGFLANVGIGANDFASTTNWFWVLAIEAILTFFVLLVILNVTSSKYTDNRLAGVVIALTFAALILIGGPLTGGSLNPARSIGPALFQRGNALAHLWLYIVGPLLGAAAAAFVAKYLLHTEKRVATVSASSSRAKTTTSRSTSTRKSTKTSTRRK